MNVRILRTKTTQTIAAGFLAIAQGRYQEAAECADSALWGLVMLGAHGIKAPILVERVARLEERLTGQG